MNTEVTKITDNMDKYNTYKELMERYKKSYENEFYFESMFIEYAVMEDRLRSILYHSGVIKERSSKSPDFIHNKEFLTNMFYEYNSNIPKEKYNIDFEKISSKISMLRAILRWSRQNKDYLVGQYPNKLKEQYQNIDKEKYLQLLKDIEKWKKYRNELIHSVLDANINSVNASLKLRVEEGKELINSLTELSRLVKKHSFVNL